LDRPTDRLLLGRLQTYKYNDKYLRDKKSSSSLILSPRDSCKGQSMPPNQPLPLSERFSDPDTYIDSLLDFITTSNLFQRLCGGVHILDFITREPDLYSAILPSSWRQFFSARELQEILDLLMREDLEQFSARSADKTPGKGSPGVSLSDDAPRPPTWRGGPLLPESLLDYIRDIRGHCLSRSHHSVEKMNGAPPKAKQTKLARHVAVGMKPKKTHEVENFARYVDDLAADLAHGNDIEITHLVDFGSGQNYLGRALASEPYDRGVIAIESKRLNIDGAREMDVTAKLAKKQQIIRNKKEYRSQLIEKSVKPDTINMKSPTVLVNRARWKSITSKEEDVSESEILRNSTHAEQSKIQYIEQEIRSGDLTPVIEKAIVGQTTSLRTLPPQDHGEDDPDSIKVPRAANASLMVISLHSCGNLLHHGIRSLILNPSVAAIALVGCYYNLVTERLGPPSYKLPTLRLPNSRLDQTSSAYDPHGFPMSERLATYDHGQGKGVRLNITARMMAVQAPYNWTLSECEAFCKRHFFRALLQRVFVDLGVLSKPTLADDTGGGSPRGWSGIDQPIILGSLPKACYSSFTAYVRGAVAKLADDSDRGLSIRQKFDVLTDAELEDYERRYHGKKKELSIIWSLMAFSATVVESVIVVDRWLFLREQELVQDCWVEAVFDYGQSPRNLVVVGIKRPPVN